MRMLLKVSIPVERGNQAIADGSLSSNLQAILGELRPEATYFTAIEGKRTALIFFDLADASQIPAVAEPFFMSLNAELELYPVMTVEDLQKGLSGAQQAAAKYMP